MENNWHSFYANRINSGYQRYFEFRYHPFLNCILHKNPKRVVEVGCGIGSVSKFLRQYNIDCLGFDITENMVLLANKNVNKQIFFTADALNSDIASVLNDCGLAVTHGVLEHFEDHDILKILFNYPNSVHYVPLNGYSSPSFGDERLLPLESVKFCLET